MGQLDADKDPSSACQDVCSVCKCFEFLGELTVNCSHLGLTEFPALPTHQARIVRRFDMANNLLTSVTVPDFSHYPML